jgi:hypothetical protein
MICSKKKNKDIRRLYQVKRVIHKIYFLVKEKAHVHKEKIKFRLYIDWITQCQYFLFSD